MYKVCVLVYLSFFKKGEDKNMKRHVFIGAIIGIFLFCTGFMQVNARTLEGKVYTTNQDYINLFYEFDNQTEFAKLLGNQGTNILDYLCSIYNEAKGSRNCAGNMVSILSPNEINFQTSDVQGFIDKAHYIFRISYVEDSILYSYNDYISYNYNQNENLYFLFYDENANFLGISDITKGLYKESKANISVQDIGRLFSHYYYSNGGLKYVKKDGGYDKIVLAKLNDLDFFDTKGMFLKFFENVGALFFGHGMIVNVDTGRFDYYQKNPIASGDKFVSFLTALMGKGISKPDGFESVDLSIYPNGVFLEPRLDCGDSCDYRLYFYKTYEKSKLYSTIFHFNEKLDMGKSYVYDSQNNYDLTYVDLLGTYELENISGHMFLFSSNTARDMIMFYNPNSFNLKGSKGTSQTLTFSYGDKTYMIKPADQEFLYNQAINANKEISNNTTGSINPGSFDFSVGNVLSGFKNFIGAVSGLGSSLAAFFVTMPSEITGFITATFIMACIAVVIKIVL